jgi:hypothetical protein
VSSRVHAASVNPPLGSEFDATPDKDGKYECKAEDCTYKSTRHPANMRQHVLQLIIKDITSTDVDC